MTPEMTLIDDPIKKSDGRKRIDRKYHRIDGEFTKIPLKSNALCDILKNKFEIIVQNVESEVPMDDSKLRALLTAVQCGSFGKAAVQLGYTQSAMTHLVSKLEAELGCTLLLRSSKGVCLSEEGEHLLPYIHGVINACDALRQEAEEQGEVYGRALRIGCFASIARASLPELLRKLCEIDGLHWIRVHYVYPDEIDDEFIQVMASEPKIVKYLDIPIQHCNSKILKLMNRRGDGEFLKALFARLRAGIPGLVIRTSLITGLPGEGEEEFAELCDFLREERLERVGAFAFSPEEGTPAAQMEHVDTDTAVKRAEIVEMLQSEIMDAYNAEKLGKTMEVLVDGYDEESGQFYGRTFADSPDIDGRVWIASDEPVHEGDFVMVKIDGCTDGDLCGYVVEEEA